jgi:hypothetical protein
VSANRWNRHAALGVGLGLRAAHVEAILAAPAPVVPFFELLAENFLGEVAGHGHAGAGRRRLSAGAARRLAVRRLGGWRRSRPPPPPARWPIASTRRG